jgi:pimeloyl-ACP methyl ester carboxylesterase
MISFVVVRAAGVKQHDRSTTFSAEEVRFQSGELAGTFLTPPHADMAALVLTGSGPLDRDANGPRFRSRISLEIAQALAGHGVCSLRYDKRGAGRSQGDYFAAGLSDNYADARAATDWLRDRCPDIPVYAIGHSEGALHAAHLAADAKVDGAVLIACPTRRGQEILIWQAAQIVPTLPAASRALLRLLRIDPLKSQRKAFARLRSTTTDAIRIQGKKVNARWLRQFMDYDPIPVFERIRVPLLVLVGEYDMQVPPEDAQTIGTLVHGACHQQVLAGISHILRADPESQGPRGYRKSLKEEVNAAVLNAVVAWLEEQADPPHVSMPKAESDPHD